MNCCCYFVIDVCQWCLFQPMLELINLLLLSGVCVTLPFICSDHTRSVVFVCCFTYCCWDQVSCWNFTHCDFVVTLSSCCDVPCWNSVRWTVVVCVRRLTHVACFILILHVRFHVEFAAAMNSIIHVAIVWWGTSRGLSWSVMLLPEFSSSLGGVCCELQCNCENSDLVVWGCVLLVGRCLIFLSFGPCHCLDRTGPSFGHMDFFNIWTSVLW